MIQPNVRNQQIDLLRGAAIFAVLILHFHLAYHLDQSVLSNIFSAHFINSVASNGNYGVTVFFVISGFLITSTSLDRYKELGKIDMIGFYIFRFARIMPCLVLALSFIALFNFLHIPIFENNPNSTSLFLAIFSVLTFWHNLLMQKVGYFNYCLNIFWSLSVEEIFYFTFPIICLLFKKLRFIIIFWLALIIMAPIYRSHYTDNEIVALYGYFSCFDAIAMGCIAAVIAKKFQIQKGIKKILLYCAISLISGVYLYSGVMENVVMGVSLIAVGAAVFLISVSNEGIKNNKLSNLFSCGICWFGKNSYELYLFHIIVLALMKEILTPENVGNHTKLIWLALFLGASALMAGIISTFYSQQINIKLRKSIFKIRQKNIILAPRILNFD